MRWREICEMEREMERDGTWREIWEMERNENENV